MMFKRHVVQHRPTLFWSFSSSIFTTQEVIPRQNSSLQHVCGGKANSYRHMDIARGAGHLSVHYGEIGRTHDIVWVIPWFPLAG